MNKKEAKQVLEIISKADGGCPYCVTELLDDFVLKFPTHKDTTLTYYKEFSIKKEKTKKRGSKC